MHEKRRKYTVVELCRILKLSTSGYYNWVNAGRPTKAARDAVLLAAIRQIERENGHNYGVNRVHRALNDEKGIRCARSRVQRIMHENGIKARIHTKYKPQTTKANPKEKAYPNLLEQHFPIGAPNEVWLTDITYVKVNGVWHYLSAVLDMGVREIVGWSVGVQANGALACEALRRAILREKPGKGLIHHSDRGCQYTSKEYRRLLESHEMIGSMSRTGNPYDNAPMESFFQTLKTEYLYKHTFSTLEQLRDGLQAWIDYYNRYRLHSALGYKSPLFYRLSAFHPFEVSA